MSETIRDLISRANRSHGGHLSIVKVPEGWQVGFGSPLIEPVAAAPMLLDAARKALEGKA